MTKGEVLTLRVIVGAFLVWMVFGLYRQGLDWAYPVLLGASVLIWVTVERLRTLQQGRWAWLVGAVAFSALFVATFCHVQSRRQGHL